MDRTAIITLPHKNLRTKSTKINHITEREQELITNMISASLDWEDHRAHELCVGLAAIQVNVAKRVVIVRANQEDKSDRSFITLINPKIIKVFGTPEYDFEGCLSVKDIYGSVPRYPKVKVQAQDEAGEEFRMTAEGFLARLLQHEVDHTNGILFVDHIKEEDKFFKMNDETGKLEKMDYETEVKDSSELWD